MQGPRCKLRLGIDPSLVPPPPAAAPVPQRPGALHNSPVQEGQPLGPQHVPLAQAPAGTVAIQPFSPRAPEPPPPAVMHAPVQAQPASVVVQPDDEPQTAPAPAGNPFAPPPGTAPVAAPKPAPARRKPVTPVAAPAAAPAPVAAPAAPEPAPANAGQLDSEISDILSGLGDFMGGK